jgi:ABC-type Zn2+ transport system substrate-binding protein/surface adhesin
VTDTTRNLLNAFASQSLYLLRRVEVKFISLILGQFPMLAMAIRKDIADACHEDERVSRHTHTHTHIHIHTHTHTHTHTCEDESVMHAALSSKTVVW